ncbi:regulatory protein RecX [Effusibacillus consociatus]|uniref:Regulatory protein RecX n=1 Tax=Effusibacillus consociatus TaxID=1117041 RepID=A0ABV9PXX8_9BACL
MKPAGKITAIQTQKAHPDRVSLFIDDQFALGIRRELAYQLGLRVGLSVTKEDIGMWRREEALMHASDMAIKYISARGRSRQQVLNYLCGKDVAPDIAEQAIKHLESLGYLNDEQFAAGFVQNRVQTKPRGRRMIRWELQQKGVSQETIEQALTVYEDEVEAARRLLSKKTSFQKTDDVETNRKTELKIGRFLARKGFSNPTIRTLIKEWRET